MGEMFFAHYTTSKETTIKKCGTCLTVTPGSKLCTVLKNTSIMAKRTLRFHFLQHFRILTEWTEWIIKPQHSAVYSTGLRLFCWMTFQVMFTRMSWFFVRSTSRRKVQPSVVTSKKSQKIEIIFLDRNRSKNYDQYKSWYAHGRILHY